VGAHLLLMLTALIWRPSPSAMSSDLESPPSFHHLLGTDHLGRDILQRVVAGSPYVLSVSFAAAVSAVALGAALGAWVAYRSGLVDLVLMRIWDLALSFPLILTALLGAAILPHGYLALYIVVTAVHIPGATRVCRAIFADGLSRDYVTAAVLRGESFSSIIVREALPNAVTPLAVEFAVRWNYALILIASLNYLGVGVQPPTPDWGLMLFEGRGEFVVAPWVGIPAAVALATLAVGINFTADGLASAVAHRGADIHRSR
jgi:peptide/nickel transport system permease protein